MRPPLLDAMRMLAAPVWLQSAVPAALRLQARALKVLPKRRRPHLHARVRRPTHPRGYRIDELGTFALDTRRAQAISLRRAPSDLFLASASRTSRLSQLVQSHPELYQASLLYRTRPAAHSYRVGRYTDQLDPIEWYLAWLFPMDY